MDGSTEEPIGRNRRPLPTHPPSPSPAN